MRLSKYFFILVFALPVHLFAKSWDGGSLSKWTLGLNFSPDYSYRVLIKTTPRSQATIDYRNDVDRPKFSFTTGFMTAYQFNDKINFEAGLLYADKGENTRLIYPNYIFLSGQNDPNIPVSFYNQYHEIYIDIPLKIAFNYDRKKFSYFFAGGFSPSIYLYTHYINTSNYHNGISKTFQSSEPRGNSFLNIAFIASAGIKYDLGTNFKLRIEPTYRQSFSSVVVGTEMKDYFYSLGLNMGIYYTFKTKH